MTGRGWGWGVGIVVIVSGFTESVNYKRVKATCHEGV